MLQVTNLSKEYPTARGPLAVLSDVSFSLSPGDAAAIMGPSGSGKSSLLFVLGALEPPTSGTVTLDGRNPFQLGPTDLAEFRNTSIGFVFQDHCLLPQCTVLENVLVPTLAHKDATLRNSAVERAKKLLEKVALDARTTHRPGQLSGGERQRVAVVRALINQPKLLLADEPTGALDRVAARNLADLLVQLNKEEGATLIVVTHALDLAKRMGRLLELKDGRLVANLDK